MELKDILILLAGIASGVITPIVIQLIQRKPQSKVQSETGLDFATASARIVEGGNEALEGMRSVLEYYEKQINELKRTTDELTARKAEREIQIHALEIDIGQLRGQVMMWESKYNELKDKHNRAMEIMANVLKDNGLPLPDELAILLGDSIAKFKLPKPGKE